MIGLWRVRLAEAMLVLFAALAVFILLALSSYHATDPSWSHLSSSAVVQNITGRVGAWLADFLFSVCGYVAYLLPLLVVYTAWLHYHRLKYQIKAQFHHIDFFLRAVGFILIIICSCGLLALALLQSHWHSQILAGGFVGEMMMTALVRVFNHIGAMLIMIANLMIGITLLTGCSWFLIAEKMGGGGLYLLRSGLFALRRLLQFEWQKRLDALTSWWHSRDQMVEEVTGPVIINMEKSPVTELVAQQGFMPPSVERSKKKPRLSFSTAAQVRSDYPLPSVDLLEPSKKQHVRIDSKQLTHQSRLVELKLADFGVSVKVVGVYPGPVVTRYELQLAPGTKVSKISGLAKDLARSLSVIGVRVVEVIPGKSCVGLELPNGHREVVCLRAVLASDPYRNSRAILSLALGKDIAGHPVVVDLSKMPHLLVAGTTGSGKSVGLNAMLLSLLYRYTPAELRLIMIDPKMLEFALYDGIPHLLTPVVTDMKDASSALRWCVVEMEKRYCLMASLGVRNLKGLNQKIIEGIKNKQPLRDPLVEEEHAVDLEVLPHIVVIADEFADMMVVVGKKVETLIARIAQKARAAGIHLILATQRPSVDVITGLIKANIPTRISFQVSSKIDSRTILDQQGAEQLLGHGDMLYLAPGTGVPIRIHGAFVSDDEVHRVVAYLKSCSQAQYIEDILDEAVTLNTANAVGLQNSASMVDSEQDSLYDDAVYFVTKARRVSVSSVQRRFKIGYNRASRIVEAMEVAGVVSRMENSGAREVLAPPPRE